MQGERTPYVPSPVKDQMAFINFVIDIKATKTWMEKAEEVIGRNEKLLATLGKADEIEKLHAEAQALKDSVLSKVEEGQQDLKKSRERFNADMKNKREKIDADQKGASDQANALSNEARALLATAKAQEGASREALAAAAKARGQAELARDTVVALKAELEEQARVGRALLNPKAA